jgi:hypothetical protein
MALEFGSVALQEPERILVPFAPVEGGAEDDRSVLTQRLDPGCRLNVRISLTFSKSRRDCLGDLSSGAIFGGESDKDSLQHISSLPTVVRRAPSTSAAAIRLVF